MTGPDPMPPTSARPLTADPITHLVLSLCARTEDITRDRTAPDQPWRLKLRGKQITDLRALGNIEIALTTLEAGGLIKWYTLRPSTIQFPSTTAISDTTLVCWDASVLAGGES